MSNTEILRQLRYALTYDDATLRDLFALGGHAITPDEIAAFLKPEGKPGSVVCGHAEMACFLNGLIIHRRGRKAGAPEPVKNPQVILTNNDVLKKLRIALELQEEDMLAILKLAGLEASKYDVSALFRKDGHKHYKDCSDPLLRLFLKGLTVRYRTPRPA